MNIIREEVPIRSFSVSAYLCKIDDKGGKILLLERTSQYLNRTWQEISGLIEPRESAWEAALREIKEETTLTPYRFYSADFVERFYEHGQNVINLVPVFVGYVHDDAQVHLSEEHSDYMWVRTNEALEYLHFSQQKEATIHVQKAFLDSEPSEHLRINFEAVG